MALSATQGMKVEILYLLRGSNQLKKYLGNEIYKDENCNSNKDIRLKQPMLSKIQVKFIQSLCHKKHRHEHGTYLIEGEKIVNEYIRLDYPLVNIYAVDEWADENNDLLRKSKSLVIVREQELKKISTLTTPNKVIAIAKLPEMPSLEGMASLLKKGLHIALESIRDPGNLGTIIRTADWFGVDSIICSDDCVDAYNPKVVQAAMGSLARMRIIYIRELTTLKELSTLKIYAATLEGKNIFKENLSADAIVLIGNESKGLSEQTIGLSTKQISIPQFGKAESLNAAVAAGVIMAEFRRARLPFP